MGPWPHLPQPLAPARPHVQVHLRHLLGQVQAMGHQLLRWQHAIHQAPSHGLLGTDETTCQGQAPLGSSWILAGWWFNLPLWKIWIRQLGLLFPIYWKWKMFQTTNQLVIFWAVFLERNWLFWSKHGEKSAGAKAQLCPIPRKTRRSDGWIEADIWHLRDIQHYNYDYGSPIKNETFHHQKNHPTPPIISYKPAFVHEFSGCPPCAPEKCSSLARLGPRLRANFWLKPHAGAIPAMSLKDPTNSVIELQKTWEISWDCMGKWCLNQQTWWFNGYIYIYSIYIQYIYIYIWLLVMIHCYKWSFIVINGDWC